MKTSSATSARATALPPQTGRSSDTQRSPTSAEFALTGPSDPPDPATHAYRKDLADIALAGQVIASHYAEPLDRKLASATALRVAPSEDSEIIGDLEPGDAFAMLDNSVGWAWGYAGDSRLVGYIRSEAVSA